MSQKCYQKWLNLWIRSDHNPFENTHCDGSGIHVVRLDTEFAYDSLRLSLKYKPGKWNYERALWKHHRSLIRSIGVGMIYFVETRLCGAKRVSIKTHHALIWLLFNPILINFIQFYLFMRCMSTIIMLLIFRLSHPINKCPDSANLTDYRRCWIE